MSDVLYRVVVDLSTKGDLSQTLSGSLASAGALSTALRDVSANASAAGRQLATGFERSVAASSKVSANAGQLKGHAKETTSWLEKSVKVAGSLGETLATSFASAAAKAADLGLSFAKIGAAGAVAASAFGIHINSELEKTQISIADTFSANDVAKGMTEGMSLAAHTIAQMRKDAAALPGEFKDLSNIFQMAVVPGIQAGASINQIREMSSQVMAYASGKMPLDQAAREFAMLIEGRAGAHNTLGMKLAGLGGDKANQFNQLTSAKRMEELTKMLGKHAESIDVYKTSFDGLFSTFIDNSKRFAGLAARGLFERAKQTLTSINDWLDRNQDKVERIAGMISDRLVAAWDAVEGRVKRILPTVEKIGAHVLEMSPGQLGSAAATGLLGLGAMKAAPSIVSGSLSATGMLAGLFGKGGAAAAGAGSLGGMGVSASALANPAGLAAAAAALVALAATAFSVAGAIHALNDETSALHDQAVEAWRRFTSANAKTIEQLQESWEKLRPAVLALADSAGVLLLETLALLAEAAAEAAKAVGPLLEKLALFADPSGALVRRRALPDPGMGLFSSVAPGGAFDAAFGGLKPIESLADAMNKSRPATGAKGGGGGTTVHKVEIVVNSNQNPSQIARMTLAEIENIRRHPRVARTQNFAVAR